MNAILPSSGTSDVLASGLIRPPSGVCVLMSTYASETADNLRTSLESLYSQTIVPERIVLVIDGRIVRPAGTPFQPVSVFFRKQLLRDWRVIRQYKSVFFRIKIIIC